MNKKLFMLIATAAIAMPLLAVEYKTTPLSSASEVTPVPAAINKPYARDYILVGKGKWNGSLENIVSNDHLYDQGNLLLSDSSQFIKKNIPANSDPESRTGDVSTKIQLVADYKNAITKLSESAKTYKNPVSAYEAVTISLKMFGKGRMNPVNSDMPILTKLLYQYEVCDGYVLYGEELEKSNDRLGAYNVYKNGMSNGNCAGWHQAVLGGRLSVLRQTVRK